VLKTTSQLLSHHRSIEEKQAKHYNILAKKYPEFEEVFNKLGKENIRHIEIAQRAYREGVTDAFEVGFLSTPLDPESYLIKEPKNDIKESVKGLIANEETIIDFCLNAASNSSILLPDLSETFERLVKRKKRNIEKLRDIEKD
jgi:hypothetical protein